MENKEIMKQMIDLHKTSFYNSFSTTVMLQDQAETFLKTFVDHTPGISDEGKKVMSQWTSVYKKSRDDFKKAMDEGFPKFEAFLDNNATVMFQDQTKKMFNYFLNQTNWMPQDLKKNMGELSTMYNKGCDEFKKYVDENIRRLQDFSPVANKSQTKTK